MWRRGLLVGKGVGGYVLAGGVVVVRVREGGVLVCGEGEAVLF